MALLLLLAGAALRWRAADRGAALLLHEGQARTRFALLARLSRDAVERGPHPGLAALLAAAGGARLLADVSSADSAYASDEAYVYGLRCNAQRGADGRAAHGFQLHAWPLRFGETGDQEFFTDATGAFWRGQNDLGRSGTDTGFPPPFRAPRPGLDPGPGNAWWRVPSPD